MNTSSPFAKFLHRLLNARWQEQETLKNTPSPLNTGAVTSKTGTSLAGGVLGVPFFAFALLRIGTGQLPSHGHSPATDAFFHSAELYLLLVVLPCSAVVSAALSTFVAPEGEERRFAAGAFFYYAQMLLICLVLAGALLAYAGIGPFWQRSLTGLTFPTLLLTLGGSLLASVAGSAAGCALGLSARLRGGTGARLLQNLWKASATRTNATRK